MTRGSIITRGDAFRLAVELPPDPQTGLRRRKFTTFRGTRREAEKELTRLLSLVDADQLRPDPKMTVAAYFDRWLADYVSNKAPKTQAGYKFLVRAYVAPHLGKLQLGKLAPADIARFFTKLRSLPRQDGREGKLSAATISATYRMLHVALTVAVKWQLVSHNPAEPVDPPSVPRKEMKTFNVEEAQKFLDASAAEGLKWQAFYTLSLQAGSRPGELKALRWSDLDLERGTMSIQQNAQRVRGVGKIVGQPKTPGGRRPVALGAEVVSLLRRHRLEQNTERLRLGPLWNNQDLVFPSEIGTLLEDKRVHQVFRRICERAGVPKIRPYDLRHSSASLLLAAGVHPKIVAERLGHANVSLTLNTYSHVLPGLQKDAADTLEAMLQRKV